MTAWKTRAVVKGLTKRDIQLNQCTVKGAQKQGKDGACEEGEEGGSKEVGQNTLNWHANEHIAWFCAATAPRSFPCNVPRIATASAKKLGVRGHGGVTALREAAMLM
jgi:hypothetical protein